MQLCSIFKRTCSPWLCSEWIQSFTNLLCKKSKKKTKIAWYLRHRFRPFHRALKRGITFCWGLLTFWLWPAQLHHSYDTQPIRVIFLCSPGSQRWKKSGVRRLLWIDVDHFVEHESLKSWGWLSDTYKCTVIHLFRSLKTPWGESSTTLVTFKTVIRHQSCFQSMRSWCKWVLSGFSYSCRLLWGQVKTQSCWILFLLAASLSVSPSFSFFESPLSFMFFVCSVQRNDW